MPGLPEKTAMEERRLMFNSQQIRSRIAFLYFLGVVLAIIYLFFGCSTAQVLHSQKPTEKPFEILIPAVKDSIVLRDSVIQRDSLVIDSLWYGEVTDSVGKVIGDVKVYFKKKIAELNLNEKHDTIYVEVPVLCDDQSDHLLNLVNSGFEWWEKMILYGGLGLIISGIIYLRIRRKKL